MKRYPEYRVFAGSLTIDTAKADLGAAYGKVGNAVNVWGYDQMTVYARELANLENATIKFFLSHSGAQPAASTNMFQLATAAGAEIEVTILQNTRLAYPLTGVSGKYLLLEGKGAVGANADLAAFLEYQPRLGAFSAMDRDDGRGIGHGLIASNTIPIAGTATAVTTTPADIGLVVDVGGLSNLTLFIANTGANTGRVTVYFEKSRTKPAGTSTMWRLAGTAGAALTFDALTNERVAIPLLCGTSRWMAIQGAGLVGATNIAVHVSGVAQGG